MKPHPYHPFLPFFFNKKPKLLVFFVVVVQSGHVAYRIFVPQPGTELRPQQSKCWVLINGPPGNFPFLLFIEKLSPFLLKYSFYIMNDLTLSALFTFGCAGSLLLAACELFPNCGKWGPLFVVHRILPVVASFVVERRLQGMQASVVVGFGLSSCGTRA